MLVQAAIGGAVAFRLEALLLNLLWCSGWPPARANAQVGYDSSSFAGYFCSVPLASLLVATQLSSSRLDYYLTMLNPLQIYDDFQAITRQFAASLQYKYSRDDAHIVVLVGVIGLISFKFMKLLGPFIPPLFSSAGRQGLKQAALAFSLPRIAAGLYFVVLLIFSFTNNSSIRAI